MLHFDHHGSNRRQDIEHFLLRTEDRLHQAGKVEQERQNGIVEFSYLILDFFLIFEKKLTSLITLKLISSIINILRECLRKLLLVCGATHKNNFTITVIKSIIYLQFIKRHTIF